MYTRWRVKLALNAFLFVLFRQKILKLFLRQMETIPGIRRDDRRGGLISVKVGNGESFDKTDTFHVQSSGQKIIAFVLPLETVHRLRHVAQEVK